MFSFAEKPLTHEMPSTKGKQKPYYPSFNIPAEAFGKTPAVGAKYKIAGIIEVKEVRKTEERGIDVRVDFLKGECSGSEKSMDDFLKMTPKEREKYQEENIKKKSV